MAFNREAQKEYERFLTNIATLKSEAMDKYKTVKIKLTVGTNEYEVLKTSNFFLPDLNTMDLTYVGRIFALPVYLEDVKNMVKWELDKDDAKSNP